jgi:general stress protein 26
MDSINQQQPEDNFKNLQGEEAKTKIKEMAEKAESCFFCSNIKTGIPFSTRPMAVQKIDDDGNFWFLSSDDSHKNEEISHDPFVHLLFQGSAHSDFLNIYGIAEISKDKEKIKELWQPILKTWFTGGEDDPRITVIKVEPSEGYYWDNKHGNAVAFIKQAAGAVLGKTLDDSVEGKLDID